MLQLLSGIHWCWAPTNRNGEGWVLYPNRCVCEKISSNWWICSVWETHWSSLQNSKYYFLSLKVWIKSKVIYDCLWGCYHLLLLSCFSSVIRTRQSHSLCFQLYKGLKLSGYLLNNNMDNHSYPKILLSLEWIFFLSASYFSSSH